MAAVLPQVGDLIAVQELDCEQWWLSQVIVRDDSRSGGRTTRCFEEVGPDFTLRIIDPRLTTENLDLLPGVPITDPKNDSKTEWATKQEHGGLPYWRPVFLGHSQSYIRAPASTATSSMQDTICGDPVVATTVGSTCQHTGSTARLATRSGWSTRTCPTAAICQTRSPRRVTGAKPSTTRVLRLSVPRRSAWWRR